MDNECSKAVVKHTRTQNTTSPTTQPPCQCCQTGHCNIQRTFHLHPCYSRSRMPASTEDTGNFGFGHLSKPFVTFRLFHFSSIFDCSRRTTKNDKEASRPLSEPPFFFRSAGWPDPSPILRIDTDRRFNHDAMAEFPCSRETSQHMLF
jgi:hypothetical protein